MRYIMRRRRKDGSPVVGTLDTLVREYKSDENAIRFMLKHLRADHFPPGTYALSTFPRGYGSTAEREVCDLYKQV